MDPHCNQCGKKFDFFTKELACSTCGFSFCKRCLSKKVCNSCSAPKKSEPTMIEPPQALLKRLEQLSVPAQPEDEISQRLQKLKTNNIQTPSPSQDDLERRLAHLKGEQWPPASTNPAITMYTQRTEDQQVQDLLREFQDLAHLDSRDSSVAGLEARLAHLKEEVHKSKPDDSQEQLSDEEAAAQILEEAMARATLPDSEEDSDLATDPTEPELPWCIICNEDATVQCMGCDGDLYCRQCFAQGHETPPYAEHNSRPYKQQPKKT